MLWHVLKQTFIDLPSSAISAAKRCSLLHCSGPAPTRHECQIASKVNFLLLTLIRTAVSVFLFYVCIYSNCFFFVTDLFYCRFRGIIWSEVIPQSPVSTAAAVLEMSVMEWACSGSLLTPHEIWCSLDTHPSLNLGWFIVFTPKEWHIRQLTCGHLTPDSDSDVIYARVVVFHSIRDTVCTITWFPFCLIVNLLSFFL